MNERHVQDVMTTDLVTCAPGTPIAEAARMMRDRDIGDVLVAEGDRLLGIVTDRDLVVRCLADDAGPDSPIDTAFSPGPVTVGPGDSMDAASQLMRDGALRRIPVVDDDRLVGIVSLGDLALRADPDSALADISAARPND